MENFLKVVRSYATLLSIALGGSAVALVSHLSGLIPPIQGLLQVTIVFQLLLLIIGYLYFFRSNRVSVRKSVLRSFFVVVPVTLVHFFALQVLTFRTASGELQVKGLQCTANALEVFKQSCPVLSQAEIESAGNIYSDLWTDIGLGLSSVVLSAIWLLFFSSICFLIAAFVSQQTSFEKKTAPGE